MNREEEIRKVRINVFDRSWGARYLEEEIKRKKDEKEGGCMCVPKRKKNQLSTIIAMKLLQWMG